MKKRMKKQVKVNKSFMTNYLRALFLLNFAIICVLLVAHHKEITDTKELLYQMTEEPHLLEKIIEQHAIDFYKFLIVTMICFFIAISILTRNLTIQITKPVESLINHFDKIPSLTHVKKINIQKGQAFEELMRAFNFLIQRQDHHNDKVGEHNYNILKR